MNVSRIAFAALAGLLLTATSQDASAQIRRYSNQVGRIINGVQNNQHHNNHNSNQYHNNHNSNQYHNNHNSNQYHNNHNSNQHHNNHNNHSSHSNHYTPGYHIDHHDHVIRDSHGHVIGNTHHDVIHQNSTYIVPHNAHANHHGTYHAHNNTYYYTPQQTASIGNSHVVQRPVPVQFGSFSHVDDLASRLETLCNEFLLDLHYNYPHNPGFRETYGEGYQLLQVAKYIHAAEHAHDRAAIQSKLNGMDALFHHLQEDVRGWSRHHHHQVGQLGILSKMDMIESALHHLMNDVGVQQAPPPGSVGGQAPAPGGFNGPLTTAPPPPSLP